MQLHREDDEADLACEQQGCDRHAVGEALLRSAEHDGDFVCPREAEPPVREGQDRYHRREQCRDKRKPDELGRIDFVPKTVHDALAEGRVDD
ncbi:MAG: hypothetical protein WAV02_09930 [Stellaceae bacterium]